MSRRTERVNELLRAELSDLIHREVKDPRVDGMVSITEVVVAPDLKRATVYVSHLSETGDHEGMLEGLQHAAHFLHGELLKRLNLRNVPQLVFRFDPSIERGARLASLIAETVGKAEPGEEQ